MFLIIFLFTAKAVKLTFFNAPLGQASDLTVENILQAINRERQLRNVLTLNADSRLAGAADFKAQDMINRNYFAHIDPDGNYIWKKIESLGYAPYSQLGENLAVEFFSTDSLVAAWMNSPTHRANILQEGFRDQGAGLAFGSTGQYHSSIANTFGAMFSALRPAAAAPAATAPLPPAPKPAPAKKTATVPATTPAPVKSARQPAPAAPAPQETAPPPARQAPIKPRQSFAYGAKPADAPQPASRPFFQQAGADALAGAPAGEAKKRFDISRMVWIVFGLGLLYLLIKDSRKAYREKLGFLDKKINNIVLLLISLVVVALLYWT